MAVIDSPLLADVRARHAERLAAVKTAQAAYVASCGRGDPWAVVFAYMRLEAASRQYLAVDNELVTLLVDPPPRRLSYRPARVWDTDL